MKLKLKNSFGNGAFKRFLRNQSGNMAMVVALVAVPLMMAGAAAVDYSSWVSVQARLQAATDAAALAAGREVNLSDQELERIANDYLRSNFGNPGNAGTPQMTMTTSANGSLRVDSRVTASNYLMRVVGQESQGIVASAEVTKEANNLEVVLAFDNSGSMASNSRLSALKMAASDFVEILFGPRAEADSLKMGVVPFSQFVNVGPDKAGAAWLDTEGKSDYSQANFSGPGPTHNWAAWQHVISQRPQLFWPGCVEARKGAMAVNDAAPDQNDPDTLFVPAFAPDEPGWGSGNQMCFEWDGNRSNCGGGTNKAVYGNNYLDDTGSGSLDSLQRHARKYYRNRVNTLDNGNVRGPRKGCNIQPIQALTNKKSQVLNTISRMTAGGYTHVAEGVGWGLRVLSPGEPFTEGASYENKEFTKAMILLTEGDNSFETEGNHNRSTYSAYGFLDQARLGSSNYWAAVNAQNTLLKDACNNVKEAGIILYSFAFNVASSTQRKLIEQCASNPEKYFDPRSNAALVKNFQQVATELRQLRFIK